MHVLARFVLGMVAALATALLAVPPATAASHDGLLLVKGVGGSAYTNSYLISQPGKEGATLSYSFQVRNTGTTLAQYRINVLDDTDLEAQLYDGTLLLKPLASSPDGYYTKAIPAGGNQALTVKVVVPAGTPTYQHYSRIQLAATDGSFLDYFYVIAEEPAVLTGSTATDLFVKQGGQAALGGSGHDFQILTAPTISGTTAATFSAVLQNSSAAPSVIGFHLYSYQGCSTAVTVKDGSLDVTAAALAGTYVTPSLAKAAKKTLTITFKNLGGCTFDQWYAASKAGPSQQQVSTLQINRAY